MKIVLVSHMQELANSVKKYLLKMIPNLSKDKIIAIGGDVDGGLGTDTKRIAEAISKDNEDTLIMCDLGSALMSATAATSLVDNKTYISSGSFVEGSFAASTLMTAGIKFSNVIKASEEIVYKD